MGQHGKSNEYRHLYNDKRWQPIRLAAFDRDKYTCQKCRSICHGKHRHHPKSPVGDHIKRHFGDERLFFSLANVQTLCKACHDGPKKREETRGFSTDTDEEGWPIDPRHPANLRS